MRNRGSRGSRTLAFQDRANFPAELENALFDNYKIHTVGIVWENIRCVRVTPHVYTSIADLDKLVRALGEISSKA